MQADNGKEFKGALLILLQKYGIQVINGAPRSPQTQGLIEQANGVVEAKLRAWKMDHGSTEWKDGLLEVTLAMNTQIHSTIGLRIESSQSDAELSIELTIRSSSFEPELENRSSQFEPELNSELGIELRNGSSQFEPELNSELGIERSSSELELGIELEPELRIEPELRRRSRARVLAQPRTELAADPVIEKAVAATRRARVSMIRKYTKRHDIQHFDIGAIVSIKVPREDRTSTDNKRLFARILEEPYPHWYRVITLLGIIQRLIPTKSLGVVEQALWSDILIPTSIKQVTLGLAAREASTSARVRVSC
ncbi:hypothetical protein V493_01099 [Pseudogymnoascus sp. VKM F-4281 (FW-2241)]|nr:hypothetical protein V493_01099 [Pseudogymnoascus sp. VKM F-4281 (FW-2241)]